MFPRLPAGAMGSRAYGFPGLGPDGLGALFVLFFFGGGWGGGAMEWGGRMIAWLSAMILGKVRLIMTKL